MRIHFVLNHGGTPASKLADVEIHFDEGALAGTKLVGCSVWRGKRGEAPTVLLPSRSYATAGGVRYYELIRSSSDEEIGVTRRFKDTVREEYARIAGLPEESSPTVDRILL